MAEAWPDRIRGVLYDLGDYPAAVQIASATTWIDGFTLEIDADELKLLDEFEDVDGGEFARRIVETELGHTAWVYEYQRSLAPHLAPIQRWPRSRS